MDLVTRNAAHVAALKEKGAHVTGTVDFVQPVSALTPEEMTGLYDIIILLTKTRENAAVAAFLKDRLAADGVIVTLQNGLPEQSVAEVVGRDKVLGCTVAWGATLLEPGVAELTSEPDSMSFGLGRMNGQKDDKLMEVKAFLEQMCPVEIEENYENQAFEQ